MNYLCFSENSQGSMNSYHTAFTGNLPSFCENYSFTNIMKFIYDTQQLMLHNKILFL